MTTARILVVDDEPDVIELLSFNLKASGYEVLSAEDGEEGLRKARQEYPDLVLLDLMLPKIDGVEVCKILRRDLATERLPIIMLTAKATEIDRILGLEFGADDYVTKPFSPREVLLRVRNLLRRTEEEEVQEGGLLRCHTIRLDTSGHVAQVGGEPLNLTATEFKLLHLLLKRRGRVQSREQLLQDVWGYEPSLDTRTVDTHVKRLREKLNSAAHCIQTVRGVGYRLVEQHSHS